MSRGFRPAPQAGHVIMQTGDPCLSPSDPIIHGLKNKSRFSAVILCSHAGKVEAVCVIGHLRASVTQTPFL